MSNLKMEVALYNAAIGDLHGFSEDFQFLCALKLGKWSEFDPPKLHRPNEVFNGELFGALKCVASSTDKDFRGTLDFLRRELVEEESFVGLVGSNGEAMEKLSWLSHFESLLRERKSARSVASFCTKMSALKDGKQLDVAVSFLRALSCAGMDENNKEVVLTTLSELIGRQAGKLRMEGMHQRGLLLLSDWEKRMREEETLGVQAKYGHVLEKVKCLWEAKDWDLAKHQLTRHIASLKLKNDDSVDAKRLLSLWLCQLAEFYTEISGAKTENTEDLYKEALDGLERCESDQLLPLRGHTLTVLADYTYARFKNLSEYFSSDKQKGMEENIKEWRRESAALRSRGAPQTGSNLHYMRNVELGYQCTEEELRGFRRQLEDLMVNSVELMFRCLAVCDEKNLEIFRIVSIWSENLQSEELARIVEEYSAKIPSHKWLIAWTQITSRLTSNPNQRHKETLDKVKLVMRVCQDHPYHSFYTIVALSNGMETGDEKATGRILAAKDIIERLRRSSGAGVTREMWRLAESYMELARLDRKILKRAKDTLGAKYPFKGPRFDALAKQFNADFNGSSGCVGSSMPKTVLRLFGVKNLPIPTPTIHVPVDKTAEYRNMVTLVKFLNEFEIFDGVNCPRVIKFQASDGITRKELVKGFDDMRQDAVMEQVFGVVNELLEARRQPGAMRTYSIIPLSFDSGVIQWCEGTMPIMEYLVGRDRQSGAHREYHKGDWSLVKASRVMSLDRKTTPNPASVLLEKLEECLKNIQPVFRHFFFENYPDPVLWYEKRKTYTRSVAVASMVGHIVGLGDRHFSNILIDKTTAEVVNIDLGIAFDQGRNLPLPELVPFRLTRDVVDPMGVCGIEGTFRRCSGSTLQVLRDSREIILTIVSVLLEDPLSQWELTDTKKQKAQPSSAEIKGGSRKSTRSSAVQTHAPTLPPGDQRNRHALRVIERLKEKLRGIEAEKAEILTTERQVGFLIDQARSIENLSLIFKGWAAFL